MKQTVKSAFRSPSRCLRPCALERPDTDRLLRPISSEAATGRWLEKTESLCRS